MRRPNSLRVIALLTLASISSCDSGTEPATSPGPASLSHTGTPDINGRVFLGSGTTTICSVLPAGSELVVRAFGVDGSFFDPQFQNCPANDFSHPVPPGRYFVRAQLPADPSLRLLPWRWLEPGPVAVDADNVVKNTHVRTGSRLNGRATLDGAPLAGVDLTVIYDDVPVAGAAFGASASTGFWEEPFGRRMILQNGLDYIFAGCFGPFPGIRSVSGFPSSPVRFPTETDHVDCRLVTGNALRFTHTATRLKLTSFPGDIGGLSEPIIFPGIGYGYSAQFPLAPGTPPQAGPPLSNRQLFRGGLVLAMTPRIALGGTNLEGYVICSVSPCRAFGFDGRATVGVQPGGRREITWDYSDAGSRRPMGYHVAQRSFDGLAGRDYVLYVFRISNQGTTGVTFTPGLFADFDVTPEIFSNIGHTELGGRLMTTSTVGQGEARRILGTVIVRSPAGGRNFFMSIGPAISEADFVAAVRGRIRNPDTSTPSDIATIHGGATVSLGPGRSTDFWTAIVAGSDRDQVIANARAAIADANARQAAGDPFASVSGDSHQWEKIPSLGAGARAAAPRVPGRLCKAGCGPK
jgi:hypothetical protein